MEGDIASQREGAGEVVAGTKVYNPAAIRGCLFDSLLDAAGVERLTVRLHAEVADLVGRECHADR